MDKQLAELIEVVILNLEMQQSGASQLVTSARVRARARAALSSQAKHAL
jgi:hypothetical protein